MRWSPPSQGGRKGSALEPSPLAREGRVGLSTRPASHRIAGIPPAPPPPRRSTRAAFSWSEPVTQYNFADRLREPTSYLGILLAIMGQLVPQLIPVDAWAHGAAALHELIGAALFFMPENRGVATAEAIAEALVRTLPPAYAVALNPPAPAPVAASVAEKAVAAMIALSLAGGLALSACSATEDAAVEQGVSSAAATFQAAIAAACTLEPEARRVADASGDAAIEETESYASALCSDPDAAVVDASTPAWVGSIVGTVTTAAAAAPASPPVE
jgi:hypothetical protein